MLQCWRRTGHLPSFFVPTPGDLTAQESPPPGICHPRQKKSKSPGVSPGGGGVLGAAGIDWCIILKSVWYARHFEYSAGPKWHKDNIFHMNYKKKFTWAGDHLQTSNLSGDNFKKKNVRPGWVDTWARDTVRWYWSADTLFWQLSIDHNIDLS